MLVLSRRIGESIMVGDEVVVTVLEVRGDVVRVGVQAPREVKVHREEVYREVAAANQAAATDLSSAVGLLPTAPGSSAGTVAEPSGTPLDDPDEGPASTA